MKKKKILLIAVSLFFLTLVPLIMYLRNLADQQRVCGWGCGQELSDVFEGEPPEESNLP